jgi:hypothetical protein
VISCHYPSRQHHTVTACSKLQKALQAEAVGTFGDGSRFPLKLAFAEIFCRFYCDTCPLSLLKGGSVSLSAVTPALAAGTR